MPPSTEDNITGYELSRNWFDWCYENPEKISPTHTAMYFFIIEHWNRMGQKDKFGLPSEMTKDAIGVKNYKTFAKVFNNLIDWGFIKIVQKSKNQYSANIIALVKNTKAITKALTKASLKHEAKQVQSIVGIIEPNNLLTLEPNNTPTWRENFEIYLSELNAAYNYLTSDEEFIKQQEKYNPNLDIVLSIEKSITGYWGTAEGWKKKRSDKKLKTPDWKATFQKTIEYNKVLKSTPTNKHSANSKVEKANDPRF